MIEAFDHYERLSAMHSKIMEAFELRENNEGDTILRELLDEWRSRLTCPVDAGVPVSRENLNVFEEELHYGYSPINITQGRIEEISNITVKYLYQHTNDDIIGLDEALLVLRLLCNCHLLLECFFPLVENHYENHISNVLDQLNVCIVVSQLDYFSEYFRHILFTFNSEFISIKEASAHIFHVVGVLNFKCHNYQQVIGFFGHAICRFETDLGVEVYKSDEYFQTRLLLAYCYEYNHQFESALTELIGLEVSSLVRLFKDSNFNMFDIFDNSDIERAKSWSESFIFNTLKNKVLEENPQALFLVADKRDMFRRSKIGDKHEILHSVAHCLNELGIKWRIEAGKTKENVIHLLLLSRAIMLYVAEFDSNCFDFQTCLYMIFGEAKDYDVCLKRINKLVDNYQALLEKNINYEMENMFYLFLVTNQSSRAILDDKSKKKADEAYEKFVCYAKRRYDYDALIHIEIFRFRFEIVQALRSAVSDLQVEQKLIELKMQPVGKNIFSIKPSAKMNQWIIQEYNKTVALYEFLVKYFAKEVNININELYNFASRFDFYRHFFLSSKSEPEGSTKEKVISDVINLIVDDFVSPQSIFMLAPLTSAMPYQHQTKNLNALERSLFLSEMIRIDADEKMEHFADLNNINLGAVDRSILNWLFQRKEYGASFVAFKHDSDISFDRYCFCLNDSEIFERPILNIDKLNTLVSNVHRSYKAHSFCENGQTRCCTTIVTNEHRQQILNICSELMLPFEKYHNKHFVFFFKGKTAGNINNHSWYIIALNNELSVVQAEELTLQLCGHGLSPKKKLALSNKNHCFIGFDIADVAVVKNDLLKMQEEYDFRFWYNKDVLEGKQWEDSTFLHLDTACCVMFCISADTLLGEESGTYKEILRSIDMGKICFVLPVGFNRKHDFENTLRRSIGKNCRSEEVLSYLTSDSTVFALRSQRGFDFKEHISEDSILVSRLRELGVLRDA